MGRVLAIKRPWPPGVSSGVPGVNWHPVPTLGLGPLCEGTCPTWAVWEAVPVLLGLL